MHIVASSREKLAGGCFSCFQPWGWGERKVGAPVLIKSCFFVCYSPVGLMNASPSGYQGARWFSPFWQLLQAGAQGACTSFCREIPATQEWSGGRRQIGVCWFIQCPWRVAAVPQTVSKLNLTYRQQLSKHAGRPPSGKWAILPAPSAQMGWVGHLSTPSTSLFAIVLCVSWM